MQRLVDPDPFDEFVEARADQDESQHHFWCIAKAP
jgi:hypothetical protein